MNDDKLTHLLSDAVSDVEPDERLDEIRARVREHRPGRRRGWSAAGGVALATAAAVTAFAVLGGDEPRTTAPDPAGTPGHSMTLPLTQEAFFVGDTGRGPRLFRDAVALPVTDHSLAAALEAVQSEPADPDYRTLWPGGSLAGATVRGDVIEVELADAALRDRPAGMSEDEAALAVEQVVHTLQLQDASERAVQFRYDGNPIDQVYGVPTSEPLAPGAATDVLSLMSIGYPREHSVVSGTFTASGENNGNEATMTWRIEDASGTVVREGFATAEGWMGERLFPWQTDPIDVSDLAPGTYTFVAANPDMSAGEGFPPDTDTRSIIVE
jgi:hypothetical protein